MLNASKKKNSVSVNGLKDNGETRRKAEEESKKTSAIITNFVDGLLYFDKENNLSLINPRAEEMLHVKKEGLIGKSITDLVKLSAFKPFAIFLSKGIEEVLRKEIQVAEGFVLELSIIPVVSGGEGLGTLIILHDISREKKIERLKTGFVSLVAHQLRTPLSATKWAIRMILDGELGKATEDQIDFLEKTYQSNERMIRLIDELLDITKIEEGRYLYNPIFTDIEPIIQFVINSYKEEIQKRNLKFRFERSEEPLPRIKIDVSKIKLAIQNLIDNAIRYTLPGGEVIIFIKRVNMEIECSIKDSGVGIFREEQERVFTKFFRGSNVIKMETEGSGLGLFITKNIIETHGGKIWFESIPGKGTTFYFTLPIRKE